jgi:hypothetical protein
MGTATVPTATKASTVVMYSNCLALPNASTTRLVPGLPTQYQLGQRNTPQTFKAPSHTPVRKPQGLPEFK